MPNYDYKCDDCGHQFEIYQSMKDDKLTVCPNCGKSTLKRLVGLGGGLIFKGTGFYLTDYKNKPAESAASTAKPAGDTKKPDTNTNKETTTKTPAAPAAEKTSKPVDK